MEKLTIREIAPYLAYGLECECPLLTEDREGSKICDIVGFFSDWVAIARKDSSVHDEFEYHEFKILLRPMSDLTKEIEHNGEKFVPSELLELKGWIYSNWDNEMYYDPEDGDPTLSDSLKLATLLAEWHFNYMNLDESLWIPKK